MHIVAAGQRFQLFLPDSLLANRADRPVRIRIRIRMRFLRK